MRPSLRPLALSLLLCAPAAAAEDSLPASAFGETFGRYAPGGDCQREPQVVVAATGLEITFGGSTDRIARPDVAWSFGGNYYQGISLWLFPYGGDERPVLLTLNAGEKPGVMLIEPHDRGYPGGPALSPRHAALAKGSPYLRCTSG